MRNGEYLDKGMQDKSQLGEEALCSKKGSTLAPCDTVSLAVICPKKVTLRRQAGVSFRTQSQGVFKSLQHPYLSVGHTEHAEHSTVSLHVLVAPHYT